MKEQMLDDMELERQRGITIKARAVCMRYTLRGPGVRAEPDRYAGPRRFSLRGVAQSLACCEGAVLLVDAFQGVEAQTVANAFAAMEHDLTIVPVINKIDLQARPARRSDGGDGADAWASSPSEVLQLQRQDGRRHRGRCSTRSSSAFRRRRAIPTAPLQAMVFDSHYDEYRGAITYVRVMNGTVREGAEDPLPARRARRTRCWSWASSSRSGAPASSCRPGRSVT